MIHHQTNCIIFDHVRACLDIVINHWFSISSFLLCYSLLHYLKSNFKWEINFLNRRVSFACTGLTCFWISNTVFPFGFWTRQKSSILSKYLGLLPLNFFSYYPCHVQIACNLNHFLCQISEIDKKNYLLLFVFVSCRYSYCVLLLSSQRQSQIVHFRSLP